MDALTRQLLEQHRPVKQPDSFAACEQYFIHCAACDGNTQHIWQPGDAAIECAFWRENKHLLVEPAVTADARHRLITEGDER